MPTLSYLPGTVTFATANDSPAEQGQRAARRDRNERSFDESIEHARANLRALLEALEESEPTTKRSGPASGTASALADRTDELVQLAETLGYEIS